MRHAAAANPGATSDHDRPLTPAGWSDAEEAGGWIAAELPPVDAVLCSSALRARQTLEATGVRGAVDVSDALYNGGIEDIMDAVAAAPAAARTVLVIGHAPGIPAAAHDLLTIARLAAAGDALSAGAGAANDTDPSGPDPTGPGPNGPDPADPDPADPDELRGFTAGALAVLTPLGDWAEIGSCGAELVRVRRPGR